MRLPQHMRRVMAQEAEVERLNNAKVGSTRFSTVLYKATHCFRLTKRSLFACPLIFVSLAYIHFGSISKSMA